MMATGTAKRKLTYPIEAGRYSLALVNNPLRLIEHFIKQILGQLFHQNQPLALLIHGTYRTLKKRIKIRGEIIMIFGGVNTCKQTCSDLP